MFGFLSVHLSPSPHQLLIADSPAYVAATAVGGTGSRQFPGARCGDDVGNGCVRIQLLPIDHHLPRHPETWQERKPSRSAMFMLCRCCQDHCHSMTLSHLSPIRMASGLVVKSCSGVSLAPIHLEIFFGLEEQ